jgi:cytochrome c553
MKQTAVEQFIEQLEQQGNSWENASIGRMNISIKIEDYLKLIEQAKEMEKQERHSEYMRGWKDGYSNQELKSE